MCIGIYYLHKIQNWSTWNLVLISDLERGPYIYSGWAIALKRAIVFELFGLYWALCAQTPNPVDRRDGIGISA